MRFEVGRSLLRDRLRERRMTQSELARKLNREKSQISDIANRRSVVRLELAKELADTLGCSIEDLYEWLEVDAEETGEGD
jgi:transcriptional regulator with XRE-family HTH domain